MPDSAKVRLFGLLWDAGIYKVGEYKWKNITKAPLYLDLRDVTGVPKLRQKISTFSAAFILEQTRTTSLSIDGVAGVLEGASWIAGDISFLLHLPYYRVLKPEWVKTDHGARAYGPDNRILGGNPQGREIILVEDVSSTGRSSSESANVIERAGGKVRSIFLLASHTSPAQWANFDESGRNIWCLMYGPELAYLASYTKKIPDTQLNEILDFYEKILGWKKSEMEAYSF